MNFFERLLYDMKLKVDYTDSMSKLLEIGFDKRNPKFLSMLLVKAHVHSLNTNNDEYNILRRVRNIVIGSFQLANVLNYQSNTFNSLVSIFTIGSGLDNIVSNFIYNYPTFFGTSLVCMVLNSQLLVFAKYLRI